MPHCMTSDPTRPLCPLPSMPWFFPLLFSWCVAAPLGLGETWEQFRGPNGTGSIAPRPLPTEWSETENIRWFTPIQGLGWSSPVVVDERIFLTSAVAQSTQDKELHGAQQLRLIALDAETGRTLFDREIFPQDAAAPAVHAKNSHASPTALWDGERLYVHFGHQGTAAVDRDGALQWANRQHAYPPTHGNGGSPILVGDALIFTCDGGDNPYTVALHRADGRELWRTPRATDASKKFSFCTPTHIEIDGRSQVISAGSNIVQSLDPVTGEVLWYVTYDGYSVVPKPLLHGGLLFVCTGFGPTTLLAIDPRGSGDVTETHIRWKFPGQNVPKTPSLIAYEEVVILCSDRGVASAVSVSSGDELWKIRLGGNYSASPLLNGDRLYFLSEEGETKVFRLGTNGVEEPQEIASSQLPGRAFASLAVIGGDLLLRTEVGLYRLGQP
jgi:outer membrane protein assembly factor BamB